MSDAPADEGRERTGGDEEIRQDAGHSVLQFLERKTGEAPRITLREEDSAAVSSPIIDPSSREKHSLPQGRGNYQFMGEIARGGMGVVLKGHDSDLGRDVAVKVLDKRLCDRMDVVQRFVEEAQIGGQLQHPGIVPVYDLGLMADERPYFTMKLVKGHTLATLLAERETPASNRGRLIDIFESVCQTMAYAHSRGVIHRDLKPANIMVGAFGEVQVVDWGLAKVLLRGGTADEKRQREARSELTVLETVRSDGSSTGSESMVGSVLGTPAYMPPEQASGLVDRLDERADVFALGAILCEILTGLPPYHGERDEIISAAAQAELEEAFQRLDDCGADPALVKVARQCLTAAPAARPANAGVLAERIHQYVTTIEERAHNAEVEAAAAGARAQEERKARKLTLALGAAVVAIVVVGGGGWTWVQTERAAQREAEAESLRLAAERDQALSAEVSAELNRAATLQGAERWDEALLAGERARALAEGGDASPELIASVDSLLDGLRSSRAEAQAREEERLDTQRLLTELRHVSQPTDLEGSTRESGETSEAYRSVLIAHHIDLDAGDLDSAADTLLRRGLGSDIALTLDAWAEERRLDGNEEGSLRLLDLAHLVDPDPERAHLRDAVANRDLDELRYLAGSGLEEQPASTLALLATSLERLEDRDTALAVYRAGAERHPGDFELLYRLARLLTPGHTEFGDGAEMREATECYRAALALNADSPWIYHYLGRLYSKLGDLERSLEHYRKALDLAPDNPVFRFRVAAAQLEFGLREEARANFEQTASAPFPLWVEGWSLSFLAHLAFARGDHDAAVDLARRAWSSPSSPYWPLRTQFIAPLFYIAAVTGDESTLLEGRDLFEERFEDNAEACNALAWNLVEISEDLGTGLGIEHLTPEGKTLILEMAVELSRRGVELEANNGDIWNTVGVALHYLGDYADAVEAMTKDVELGGIVYASSTLPLALAYHGLGDEAEARRWFARGLQSMATGETTVEERWFYAQAELALGKD